MALTRLEKARFMGLRILNQTLFKVVKVDIYGVKILGIQFTPKSTADVLKVNGDFSPGQKQNFNIKLVLGCYIFLPR